ncbi:PREDICTED: sorting nexin-20-like [Gekko japonicus]|uniref:Sorting nexin-20-like n=1 Tax=Gekko japonicus TaxID=146911 RepID=A0ABM1L822_GEKJA|nr:PREDICTED: sorting nexin-20-like [Gekko japonicus]
MEGGQPYPGKSHQQEATGVTPGSPAAAHSDEDDGYEVLTSFQANREQKETGELTGARKSPKNSPSPSSSMTTKQLQEYWRNEKRSFRAVKVLFEISSARIVENTFSKYVKYQIIIIQTGSFDSDRSIIERRYSDFERLHADLLKTFYDEMEDVPFPKKSLTGNFTEDIITERKLAFQDYLRLLYSMECIQTSRIFIDFLIRPEMEEAYSCLRGGQYPKSLEIFLQVVPLQEKLIKHRPILLVPTLCAILICHKDLDDSRSAYEFGERALLRLQNHPNHRYFMPLLEAMISLAYDLGKDFVSLQEKLEERKAKKGPRKAVTLKELVVREYVQ